MAGTVSITDARTGTVGRIVATCTADAADGSFPDTALPPFSGRLIALVTNPGATAPTDNYDVTLVDGDGLDRLGGVGANRDTTTSERVAISGAPACAFGETLTLNIDNNSVNSAIVVVTLIYDTSGGAGEDAPVLLGSLTETAPAADTASSGLNGRLQRIAQNITTLTAKFANAIEIAPAATTMTAGAYTALDQIGTLLTFPNVVSAAGRACRVESIMFANKDNPATSPILECWLFNAAPTLTSPGDNNPWQPTDNDIATLLDVLDSGNWRKGAATALNQWCRTTVGKVYVTGATTSLYAYLVLGSAGALTGASTTDLTVRLAVTPDV